MLARFFVDRPVFATVLSVVIVLVGVVALVELPVAQYPEVVPPTISITASYPGASATVVADSVASAIEQEVNGVENMMYMTTKCTNDGQMRIDVTFRLGTDIDEAQVLTQNRVSRAEPKVPEEVRRQGIVVNKRSPSILMAINIVSTEEDVADRDVVERRQLEMSRFATTQVKDSLARIEGVGDITFLGARDFGMRLWLNPERLAARDMTAGDVLRALREQNVQVAAGQLGQPPGGAALDRQITINAMGRLLEPSQFDDIILKRGGNEQIVRVRDVARSDYGAKNYEVSSYVDGKPAVTLAVFQLPGSNALATAERIKAEMRELRKRFPAGVDYAIHYDTTVFIEESIHEVYKTLFEAFALVFIVVLIFLQDWRATLLPMIDVPVSLIGTFAVMALMGFSLNNLSLFGLVLAIGIVVDDAIVVVENIERWMATGLSPRDATIKAMDEITGPVIAITLVLSAVFIPTAFIAGISGEFYRQFALTIAVATIISAINALTMAPARAVTLLRSHAHGADAAAGHGHNDVREALPRWGYAAVGGLIAYAFLLDPLAELFHVPLGGAHGEAAADHAVDPLKAYGLTAAVVLVGAAALWFAAPWLNRAFTFGFRVFNRGFDALTKVYGVVVSRFVRVSFIGLVLYAGLLGLTGWMGKLVPTGFIPEQDKGYLVVAAQLPEGASLARTEAVMARAEEICRSTPGVAHVLRIPGYSILQGVNLTSAGGMYVILDAFEHRRHDRALHASRIAAELQRQFLAIQEGTVLIFGAPAVDGLGTAGGFKLNVQALEGASYDELEAATQQYTAAANATPGLIRVFSGFRSNQPQLYLDVDRTKVKTLGISLSDVFETLQAYLGSAYANDFTLEGRNWQVNVQADADFRRTTDDITRLEVRTAAGQMVKLGSVLTVRDVTGPSVVNRFNMFTAAEVNGGTLPGFSSGQAVQAMDDLAVSTLPPGMTIAWTELTYLQIEAAGDFKTKIVFPLGVAIVFLVLAAQYESWSLPIAVILIVPMSVLSSLVGIYLFGGDNNIFTQVGLLVLVALAAKNAILIVEFAKERQSAGVSRLDAVVEACTTRLRPIIMTSLAFILGVVPLALGTGAGAEMRNTLGIAVLSGMLGVTLFGIFLTPVFYNVVRRFSDGKAAAPPLARQPHDVSEAPPPTTP